MEIILDSYLYKYENTTKAINSAIKELSDNGGGKIVFSANKKYISGMIILRDNIELYFEKNSMLMASSNISDFNYLDDSEFEEIKIPTYKDCSYNGLPSKFFIYGYQLNNIKITGDGIIDGNEEIFYGKQNDHHIDGKFYPRVPLIYLEDCHNFEINNINIQRSGFWTIHLIGCSDGVIENISIKNNRKFACTDGIDPDHSKNLVIRNCYIESADDCVVFKTTENNMKYGDTENILVENCEFITTSAGVKFGSESCSNIHDITVRNINIHDSNRGISFQLRDQGNIYNINFSNISIQTQRFHPLEWWGKGEPIFITSVRRRENTKLGYIKDIKFDNINMTSENGLFIYGENNISNIDFNNIKLELKSFTTFERGNYDLRPYYKDEYLIKRKASGIYLNGANNINVNHFDLNVDDSFKDSFEDNVYLENCFDININ